MSETRPYHKKYDKSVEGYDGLELTRTERRLFDILADGEPHAKDELIRDGMRGDEYTSISSLHAMMCNLRMKLREYDEDILCQSFGKAGGKYRRIRLLVSQGNGNGKPTPKQPKEPA